MKPRTYHKRLLEMEDIIKMYVYGFRDISTKCRTRYLLAVSLDNKLTPTTPLLLYPADRELKDFIVGRYGIKFAHEDEWYMLDETNKILDYYNIYLTSLKKFIQCKKQSRNFEKSIFD